jgi:hypothetical protein
MWHAFKIVLFVGGIIATGTMIPVIAAWWVQP